MSDSLSVPRTKRCSTCKEALPTDRFSPNNWQSDGLNYRCRICHAAAGRLRRQAQGDTVRARDRANYARSAAEKAEYSRNYYRAHREQHSQSIRAWYDAHKTEVLAYAKEYHKQHPEYGTKNRHARRARIKEAPQDGSITVKALNELLATWTGTCPLCGNGASPTIDHIIAIAVGGSHTLDNLQLICKSCNSTKGSR